MKNPDVTDWHAMREQIEAMRVSIEQGSTRSPAQQKAVLVARAHELAREAQVRADATSFVQAVEFDLASERYGFDLGTVREVCLLRDLTPVPCTPAFIAGVINLRGEILTVIDIKKFFDLPEKGITDLNKIIIIHGDGMQLGVLADSIRGVRAIPLDDLQPTLPTLTGMRADYLRGVTSERLILLDAVKILTDQRIIVHEEVAA
jgi:purine-binding chemotaxis protein CheW